ncbi:MAG: dTMP kinase [Desulfobacteraceae bacterium]|nr:dTMP kinase [Desulfobacteraceae bacterium]
MQKEIGFITGRCCIYSGKLITLCGGEGAGKSTQAKKIFDFFQSENIPCILTKEPGGTKIGLMIRKILLSPENSDIYNKTELLLYLADRAEHFHKVIVPGLQNGKIVICDRFIDSTFVYQGEARGMDIDFINYVHKYILGDFLPDLTLVLDCRPKSGLERVDRDLACGTRTEDESRFDSEKISFHEKIRAGFLKLAEKNENARFYLIDAEKTVDNVFESIKSAIIEKGIIQN